MLHLQYAAPAPSGKVGSHKSSDEFNHDQKGQELTLRLGPRDKADCLHAGCPALDKT
jgi:hypothetical protein